MIVLATSAIPNVLRGKLTRWLFELEPGIFVGNVSARVRDELWREIEENKGQGRALLVFPARNEQGLDFRTTGSTWQPYDLEGLTLIMQPQRERKRSGSSKKGKTDRAANIQSHSLNSLEDRMATDEKLISDGEVGVGVVRGSNEGLANRENSSAREENYRSEGWSIAARRRRFRSTVERQAHF